MTKNYFGNNYLRKKIEASVWPESKITREAGLIPISTLAEDGPQDAAALTFT